MTSKTVAALLSDLEITRSHARRSPTADVHYGLAAAKATDRLATLAVARAANPERFTSSTAPKILHLPDTAWINPPNAGQASRLTPTGLNHLDKYRLCSMTNTDSRSHTEWGVLE